MCVCKWIIVQIKVHAGCCWCPSSKKEEKRQTHIHHPSVHRRALPAQMKFNVKRSIASERIRCKINMYNHESRNELQRARSLSSSLNEESIETLRLFGTCNMHTEACAYAPPHFHHLFRTTRSSNPWSDWSNDVWFAHYWVVCVPERTVPLVLLRATCQQRRPRDRHRLHSFEAPHEQKHSSYILVEAQSLGAGADWVETNSIVRWHRRKRRLKAMMEDCKNIMMWEVRKERRLNQSPLTPHSRRATETYHP